MSCHFALDWLFRCSTCIGSNQKCYQGSNVQSKGSVLSAIRLAQHSLSVDDRNDYNKRSMMQKFRKFRCCVYECGSF